MSSPIRRQLCLNSRGLSLVAAEAPAGAEYREPTEFNLDCVLEPNLEPVSRVIDYNYFKVFTCTKNLVHISIS